MSATFSKESVRNALLDTFAKYAHTKVAITEQSHITGDLGVDSLAVMEIVAELEDRYDLTFPDEDLPTVRTVGDVIALVCKHLQADGRLS
jgi:acyl carrier protein